MVRRLLSIWLPRLASDASLRRRPVEGPFALSHRAGNSDHVHCLNLAAEEHGLRRGMPLADARAICPDVITRPADLAREAAALEILRRWAIRYSPMVATDGTDALLADVTGVAHLFGGEDELRAELQAHLERAGYTVVSAIAGTRGAAHALARFGGGIIADGALEQGLAPLPVAALRIDHATAEALGRVGLSLIGDLIPLPRAPLARRFGQGLVMRLNQALGSYAEPVAAEKDAPHFGVRMTLPEPIGLQSDVMAGLERLLQRLCSKLAEQRMGARRVRLELRRVDRAAVEIEIGLARAMRDPERIARLFVKGVEEIDAGFGIDALRLTAPVTEDLPPEQIGGVAVKSEDALADMISRLGNRISFDRVLRLLPAESQIPERSYLLAAAAYSEAATTYDPPGPLRPMSIFPPEPVSHVTGQRPGNPPASFRWRSMRFTTLRAHGPERIAPEWWFDDPAWRSGLRDYWRIETKEGPRLWLFHTPQEAAWSGVAAAQCWHAQGEFA